MASAPLCACGRSRTPPLCDGSHAELDWACAPTRRVRDGFLATGRYQNLARRLAAELGGAVMLPGRPWPDVERWSGLAGLGDLHELRPLLAALPAATGRLFLLDGPASAAREAAPGVALYALPDAALPELARAIARVLQDEAPAPAHPVALPSAFLSHAVADEPLLLPALDRLRVVAGVDLFLCADSIPPGADWHAHIERALRTQDVFVALLSEATRASHFCSFELGVAVGLGKPVLLFSLDGTRPPAFAARIQCVDLPRLAAIQPWLDRGEVLVRELARGLAATQEGPRS